MTVETEVTVVTVVTRVTVVTVATGVTEVKKNIVQKNNLTAPIYIAGLWFL